MKMKHNISNQTNDTEQLPPILEKLRQEVHGFKVPYGYFDTLSPRIVDGIKNQENRLFFKAIVPTFRKPLVWAPVMVTLILAVVLVFVIPAKKASTIQVVDEWTEINMAYDPSYAEEVILAESNTIEQELEGKKIKYYDPASLQAKEPTDAEIKDYLKYHALETEVLNQY